MKRIAALICMSLIVGVAAIAWAQLEEGEVPMLFAVGIPDAAAPPTIDGDLSDWENYPDWNVLTFTDDFVDNSFGTVKDLNSLDFWMKAAWHEPTNMIYFCAQVFDDVHVQGSSPGQCAYWKQDDLEWYVDANNNGGKYNGGEPEGTPRCADAQQLAILAGGLGDDQCICAASKWSVEAPYLVWAAKVEGNITTYEVAYALFDWLDETAEASTRHMLFEGDVIAISFDIDDQDVEGAGQTTAWYTTPLTSLYNTADNLNDMTMAPKDWTPGAGPTAARPDAWGRIKASFVK